MTRWRADRTWLVYRGTESFAMAIGWTLAPVYFVLRRGDDVRTFEVAPQPES